MYSPTLISIATLVLSTFLVCNAESSTPKLTDVRPATAYTQEIADKFKETLESETQRTFEVYEAIEYAYQEPPVGCRPPRCIVDSATLFIKVRVDDDEYVHLKIFYLPFGPDPFSLSDYRTGLSAEDPLVYF